MLLYRYINSNLIQQINTYKYSRNLLIYDDYKENGFYLNGRCKRLALTISPRVHSQLPRKSCKSNLPKHQKWTVTFSHSPAQWYLSRFFYSRHLVKFSNYFYTTDTLAQLRTAHFEHLRVYSNQDCVNRHHIWKINKIKF